MKKATITDLGSLCTRIGLRKTRQFLSPVGVFALFFLLLVAGIARWTLPGLAKDIRYSIRTRLSFAEAKEWISEKTKTEGRIPCKSRFVDLNGGVCRLAGRRMCNGRIRFLNGHVGELYDGVGLSDPAVKARAEGEIAALDGELKSRGIPFLFVMAPRKMALEGRLFPLGWSGRNMNRDAMDVVASLERRGVRVLNLIPRFAATVGDETENFFATDHHWRFRTAFEAARLAADELADIMDIPALRGHANLDWRNWKWERRRRFFLGSDGSRTGRLFVEPDDFEFALPMFETDISRLYPTCGLSVRGDFRKSVTNPKLVRRGTDVTTRRFGYYGRGRDLMKHINHGPSVPVRVMVVKDSFGLPVSVFWTTVFREVIVVDTREFKDGVSLLDIIDDCRPDLVVELVNPGFLSGHSLPLARKESV